MSSSISRRRLLQSLALVGVGAGGVGCSGTRSAARAGAGRVGADGVSSAGGADAAATLGDLLTRRLERATFGVTDAVRREVERSGGFERWVDRQLSGDVGDAGGAASKLLADVEAHLPTTVNLHAVSRQEKRDTTLGHLQTITGRTVLGAAFGPDQIRQRVAGVLGDLLHVSSSSRRELYVICDYDALLRRGAFGRYADLVVASAKHPAMLLFLDQATSRADGGRVPNENYAREVMELHTVGVDGGYDEGDVVELAHVLSGWTIDRRTRQFEFREHWHDIGAFGRSGDILGWRPSGEERGEAAGSAVLEHLARHRATARRVSHLLARCLVSESIERDHALVSEAADIYQRHDTAIGPVVRHLLTTDRFPQDATLMLRRPLDLVAHVLRMTTAPSAGDLDATLLALVGLTRVLGQVPYAWPAPNGYPFGSAAWSNAGAMIGRWNAMTTLAAWGGSPSPRLALSLEPGMVGAADAGELVALLCEPAHQLV